MNIVVVGASGYSGIELIRLLLQHPKLNIVKLFVSSSDKSLISDIYPHLQALIDLPVNLLDELSDQKLEKLKNTAEVVFLATPSGVSKSWGPKFLKSGFRVIDLSGDFRLKSPEIYEEWYQQPAPLADELSLATYGLPEWFSDEIVDASYIANPGCYATSIILALAPMISANLTIKSIVVDAKSGISGAGKGFSRNTHFSEVNENFKAYKIGKHQHIPEIEQALGMLGVLEPKVQMITHLLPMTRGILSTIYVEIEERLSQQALEELYTKKYHGKAFVRVRTNGDIPETKQVYGTNFCDIGMFVDQRTNRIILFSVIDNLVKGAAGQAIQNLNIMMGWDEGLGLTYVPMYP